MNTESIFTNNSALYSNPYIDGTFNLDNLFPSEHHVIQILGSPSTECTEQALSQHPDAEQTPTRKRRNKSDKDGRTHACNLCNKSYLSYPALYTHNKTKHTPEFKPRTVGRPGKTEDSSVNTVDPQKDDFFNVEGRKKVGKEKSDLVKEIELAYKRTFPNAKGKCELIKYIGTQNIETKQRNSQKIFNEYLLTCKCCDEAMALYLRHVCDMVCESFLITVIKFVMEYREYLNSLYSC